MAGRTGIGRTCHRGPSDGPDRTEDRISLVAPGLPTPRSLRRLRIRAHPARRNAALMGRCRPGGARCTRISSQVRLSRHGDPDSTKSELLARIGMPRLSMAACCCAPKTSRSSADPEMLGRPIEILMALQVSTKKVPTIRLVPSTSFSTSSDRSLPKTRWRVGRHA